MQTVAGDAHDGDDLLDGGWFGWIAQSFVARRMTGVKAGHRRRQIADDKLKEVLGAIEVLEPMLTEIAECDIGRQLVGDELARCAGDQHLPRVFGG